MSNKNVSIEVTDRHYNCRVRNLNNDLEYDRQIDEALALAKPRNKNVLRTENPGRNIRVLQTQAEIDEYNRQIDQSIQMAKQKSDDDNPLVEGLSMIFKGFAKLGKYIIDVNGVERNIFGRRA